MTVFLESNSNTFIVTMRLFLYLALFFILVQLNNSKLIKCYCWKSVDCQKSHQNRTLVDCLGCRYHYKREASRVDSLGCATKVLDKDYCEKDGKGKTCYCRNPLCNDKP